MYVHMLPDNSGTYFTAMEKRNRLSKTYIASFKKYFVNQNTATNDTSSYF